MSSLGNDKKLDLIYDQNDIELFFEKIKFPIVKPFIKKKKIKIINDK